MADGSGFHQNEFPFRHLQATSRLRPGEIVVDLFAGGGGASHALETALARAIDIAINHNPWAIGMHAANHPFTKHLCEDVWEADPWAETLGRLVGWLHASPDCTHHSQARGGQPRDKATRALSWVVLKWAGKLRMRGTAPRIISLENVEQILKWGPLIAKRDKATGRVIKLVENRIVSKRGKVTIKYIEVVAQPGERVPVQAQYLIPDKRHEGRTWRQFVAALRALGYEVDWWKERACDFGAGTSRMRLYMVARCDGELPRRGVRTHGPGHQLPYVTAADCIDWSIPTPSIFQRKKALVHATHRRIAKGIKRFVLDAAEPFVVRTDMHQSNADCAFSAHDPLRTIASTGGFAAVTPTLIQCANASSAGIAAANKPLGVVTAWPKGGSHALVAPTLAPLTHQGSDRINAATQPLPTITGAHRGELSLIASTLVQAGHGDGKPGGAQRWGEGCRDVRGPLGVVTASGGHAVAAAHLVKFRGASDGGDLLNPLPVITSGAGAARPAGAAHAMGVVVAHLEQANGGFYEGDGRGADEPMSTITGSGSQQRLVTANMVTLRGSNVGASAAAPVRTLSAGGEHHAVVECTLSPEHTEGALRVADFLMAYLPDCGLDPATATVAQRLALVTVLVDGVPYVIVDIGLRMLRREELFRAQGFPPHYVIDRTADGRLLSISRSVQMVGNSVSPQPLFAIAAANLDPAQEEQRIAA